MDVLPRRSRGRRAAGLWCASSLLLTAACTGPQATAAEPAPASEGLVWVLKGKDVRAGVGYTVEPGRTGVTVGAMMLCTHRPVTVTGVTLRDARGLRIESAGARLRRVATEGATGSDAATPARLGFSPLPLAVDAPCGASTDGPPLQVEVAVRLALSTGTAAGRARGVRVAYTDEAGAHHEDVDLGMRLCPATTPCA